MSVPLVTLTRGPLAESVHHGSYCVVVNGRVERSRGDLDRPVYYRSAAKPLQALAVVASGAPDRFEFTDAELAMTCGSHDSAPVHARTAAAMLEKIGADPALLRCGGHVPINRAVHEQYVRAGTKWGRLEDNCSGKHAGMLGAAQAWGCDLASYADPGHRVQQENLANVARLTGLDAADVGVGVDGCAVPCFAVPLPAMARGMARFTTPDGLDDATQAACARLMDAIAAHPEMIAGERRFDTRLSRASGGRLVAKEGAEGVQVVGVRGEDIGIAVKIADGGKRAAQAVAAALLLDMGLVDGEAVAGKYPRNVDTREGEPCGAFEVAL